MIEAEVQPGIDEIREAVRSNGHYVKFSTYDDCDILYPCVVDRYTRLHGVLYYIQAMEDIYKIEFIPLIAEFHDHKGCLMVVWKKRPPARYRKLVARAWERCYGEPNSLHYKQSMSEENLIEDISL